METLPNAAGSEVVTRGFEFVHCSNYVCFNGAKCASVVLWRKVLIIPTQPLISSHTAEMIADVIQIASLGHLPARPGHKDISKASSRSITPHVLRHASPRSTCPLQQESHVAATALPLPALRSMGGSWAWSEQ